MTDKPTPTADLLKRCAEIHEWRSTGVLSGEALRVHGIKGGQP